MQKKEPSTLQFFTAWREEAVNEEGKRVMNNKEISAHFRVSQFVFSLKVSSEKKGPKPRLRSKTKRRIVRTLIKESEEVYLVESCLKIGFACEKMFNFDGPDDVFCSWQLPADLQLLRSKRSFGGGSVMF